MYAESNHRRAEIVAQLPLLPDHVMSKSLVESLSASSVSLDL